MRETRRRRRPGLQQVAHSVRTLASGQQHRRCHHFRRFLRDRELSGFPAAARSSNYPYFLNKYPPSKFRFSRSSRGRPDLLWCSAQTRPLNFSPPNAFLILRPLLSHFRIHSFFFHLALSLPLHLAELASWSPRAALGPFHPSQQQQRIFVRTYPLQKKK